MEQGVHARPDAVPDLTLRRHLPLTGLATFAALIVVQHATRADDLPPADHFISEYARGPGGWVQVIAFLAWAVSLAATAALTGRRPDLVATAALTRRRPDRPIAWGLTTAGLAIGAIGAVACAAFATETVGGVLPKGAVKSTAGQLHDLGSAGIFFGLLLAALASFRLIPRRGYRLSVAALGLLLFLIPAALVAAGYDAPGWGQRGVIAVGCLWQWRFVQTSRES